MLHYQTISILLKESLVQLMEAEVLKEFRLVGGTSLSLHLGHRKSVDIDLFTDAPYGSIDFLEIDAFLDDHFSYVDDFRELFPGMGKSYLIGEDRNNAVKLDVYHTDDFINPERLEDGIRLATVEEIIAMKLDIIQRQGRKKDFWDLHALLADYSLEKMLSLHQKRYPYSHDREKILTNFIDFRMADDDFDPICLLGKYWQFIKEDIQEVVSDYMKANL